MKYLFFVHSSITSFVAESIIEYEGLSVDDVLLLVDRGIIVDEKYKSIEWPYTYLPDSFPSHFSIIKSIKKLRLFDQYVEEITNGERFIAFVPQTSIRFIQLLISHPKCAGFNIMEEGLASYRTKEDVDSLNNEITLHDKLAYLFRIKNKKFIHDDYTKLYSISSEAFPGYDRKVVLDINKINSNNLSNYAKYNDSIILVFDAISVFNITEVQNHIGAILKLIKRFEDQGIKRIFFKLHPAQIGKGEGEFFRKILASNDKIEFEEVLIDESLEEIAKSCNNVQFYVNVSSTGYYAKLFGKQVYSYAFYLIDFDPNYNQLLNSLSPVFRNSVTFLP